MEFEKIKECTSEEFKNMSNLRLHILVTVALRLGFNVTIYCFEIVPCIVNIV